MNTYHKGMASLINDRRRSPRFRISHEARLELPAGSRAGTMTDLSEMGARFTITNPPPEGASALLVWGENEVWCKVRWVAQDCCGLAFDRPVARSIVLETTGQDEEYEEAPVADFNNIPVGQKRSRGGFRQAG